MNRRNKRRFLQSQPRFRRRSSPKLECLVEALRYIASFCIAMASGIVVGLALGQVTNNYTIQQNLTIAGIIVFVCGAVCAIFARFLEVTDDRN